MLQGMEDDVEPSVAHYLPTFGPVFALDDDTSIIGGMWVKAGYRGKIAGRTGIR